MSKEEGKAKAKNHENPSPNMSELRVAVKQCAPLPKNRKVAFDSSEESTEQS